MSVYFVLCVAIASKILKCHYLRIYMFTEKCDFRDVLAKFRLAYEECSHNSRRHGKNRSCFIASPENSSFLTASEPQETQNQYYIPKFLIFNIHKIVINIPNFLYSIMSILIFLSDVDKTFFLLIFPCIIQSLQILIIIIIICPDAENH